MLQRLIELAHHTKRQTPLAFNVMKLAVPRPLRQRLYRSYFERKINQNASARTVFENIYSRNWWRSAESRSGLGSELSQTKGLREALASWLAKHASEISIFLDAPCGDFNWMRLVTFPANTRYLGGDIVPQLIAASCQRFQSSQRSFIELNIIEGPIPHADAWLCRDAIIHFPFSAGVAVVNNFRRSTARYLLATTFTRANNLEDIPFGWCRQVNLSIAPFDLGKPIELIADPVEDEHDRYIGVWRNPNL
jgi:hypothetical protein